MNCIAKYDWKNLRSANNSERLPIAIGVLAESEDENALEDAYWSIDNESVVQGRLFQSSLPVTCCILSVLDDCKDVARPYILELLVQFVSGQPDKSEMDYGNNDLTKNIRSEVIRHVPIFFQILESGYDSEKAYCVDILGICALEDETLKHQVKSSFLLANKSFKDIQFNKLIENWLREIE